MRKTVSPSVAGAATATARVDPGAITTTTTVRKVAAVGVCLESIPSHCRYPHQQTIIVRRTRGDYQELRDFTACLLGGAQAPLSNRHFKQLSREIAVAQPSVGNCLMKWSTCKIGFDEEDHPASTRGVGTLLLLCTPTINNVAVNRTLIDGGAGLNIISVKIFEKMQVPYHQLMPTRPFFRVTEGSTMPIG
jgi:hypothetical protein